MGGEGERTSYKGQTVTLTRILPPSYNGLVTILIVFQVWQSIEAQNNYTKHRDTAGP